MSKSSTGISDNIAGLLCYILGWITGLIFYLVEKNSRYVRFHALQSIFTFVGVMVVIWILGLFSSFLSWLCSLAAIALWVLLMLKAYNGEMFKLPVVGDLAEQYLDK